MPELNASNDNFTALLLLVPTARPLYLTVLLACCLLTIILLTILGNILVLTALCVDFALRSPTHLLMGNLACADLLLGNRMPVSSRVRLFFRYHCPAVLGHAGDPPRPVAIRSNVLSHLARNRRALLHGEHLRSDVHLDRTLRRCDAPVALPVDHHASSNGGRHRHRLARGDARLNHAVSRLAESSEVRRSRLSRQRQSLLRSLLRCLLVLHPSDDHSLRLRTHLP